MYSLSKRNQQELHPCLLAKIWKSGVPTGGFAIHPVSGDKIPIWIGDYVLMEYGTGAVMEFLDTTNEISCSPKI